MLSALKVYHHQLSNPIRYNIHTTTFKVLTSATFKHQPPNHTYTMSAAPASWSLEGKVAVVTGSGTGK